MPPAQSAQNIYAVLQDLNEEHGDDEAVEYEVEDSNQDFEVAYKPFDLLALEEERAHEPIFSRDLLQSIATEVAYITTEQIKPPSQRGKGLLQYEQFSGQPMTIWKGISKGDSVTVHYLPRVEMHPAFRRRFGTDHERTALLRHLNPSMTEEAFANHTAPYFIKSYRRTPDNMALDSSIMDQWRAKLKRTQQLWNASTSCSQLLRLVEGGASQLKTPITKIVCIGLGKLDVRPAWYQSAFQHMTVFAITNVLDKVNQTQHPGCGRVSILAQDPCYGEKDRILLQELTSTPITFAQDDPNTLLAIDANTLVVSAYLPLSMPLAQIVADMFASGDAKGPAMMLWDKMEARKEKRWYRLRDRDSPRVARMLDGYVKWLGNFVALDESVRKDVKGDGEGHWQYWMDDMELWRRKDT
jgi:hypothetical protein